MTDRLATFLRQVGAPTTTRQDAAVVALGGWLIGGVFLDGWAHANKTALETFFTPWHAVLYSGAAAVFGYLLLLTRQRGAIPAGYGLATLGAPVFLLAGGGDFLWHELFGLEVGIDALLSPTHLMLLASGLLVLTGPWRADRLRGPGVRGSAVLSLGLATALCAFFLLYTSAFMDPSAADQLTRIPEGAPGHDEAELPAVAGLSSYLVTTALLVVPVLLILRRGIPPIGSVTALLVGVTTLSAAVAEFDQPLAPLAALVAGAAVEGAVRWRTAASDGARLIAAAVALPAVLWPAQLLGVAVTEGVRWPVELWSGIVLLTCAVAALLGYVSLGNGAPPGQGVAGPARTVRERRMR